MTLSRVTPMMGKVYLSTSFLALFTKIEALRTEMLTEVRVSIIKSYAQPASLLFSLSRYCLHIPHITNISPSPVSP